MRWCTLSVAATLALQAACSTTTIKTDHDPAAPFLRYRTYAIEDGRLMVQGVEIEDSLVHDRIVRALNRELAARGLRPEVYAPDLIVTFRAGTRTWEEYHSVWDSGWGDQVWFDQRRGGGLLVDVKDADTGKLVWRGTAVTEDKELRSRKFIDKTVRKLLARYPAFEPAG